VLERAARIANEHAERRGCESGVACMHCGMRRVLHRASLVFF
jgi:hypothetical protein